MTERYVASGAAAALGSGDAAQARPGIRSRVRALIRAVRLELRVRRDTAHVASLTDEALRDIGIPRGEIAFVVRTGRPR